MADARARWFAPGRVNLIGEHTDYNGGFVLPFAIAAGCTATVTVTGDERLTVASAQQSEPVSVPLDALRSTTGSWVAYVAGVVWAVRAAGHPVPGLRIQVDSDVPVGAGLSSSAALVCSVACALDAVLGLGLTPGELLAVTRRAENDVVGAPTGGMDQLVSLEARTGHALFCDMRALYREPIPFAPAAHGLAVLVVDTHAPHRHADGEYGRRRAGCERAAEILQVATLRDVPQAALGDALADLPDDELRRYVRHVVTENGRVLETVDLLRAEHVARIGPLLTASHVSLRDDYRVSVPHLDVAVDALLAAGALGARMTGGGFGGCVIALLPRDGVHDAVEAVRAAYRRHGFASPTHLLARPSAGARPVA